MVGRCGDLMSYVTSSLQKICHIFIVSDLEGEVDRQVSWSGVQV